MIALADNPDYVFRETPQDLIDAHYRQLTIFSGYAESEVASAEERFGFRFPLVFRQYLLEMGKSCGDLFRGSDLAGIEGWESFRDDANALIAEVEPGLILPSDAAVFLFHQGYNFSYFLASGGFDASVMNWMEGEREPRQISESFAGMVDAELRLMEEVNRKSRERGGHYRTVHADGRVSMHWGGT